MPGDQISTRIQTDSAPLRARFKALLNLREQTVAAWARENGFHESAVWMTLSGEREYPEIRDAIAPVLGLTRTQLDEEIAEAAPAEKAS